MSKVKSRVLPYHIEKHPTALLISAVTICEKFGANMCTVSRLEGQVANDTDIAYVCECGWLSGRLCSLGNRFIF